jgi:hypothetical protein
MAHEAKTQPCPERFRRRAMSGSTKAGFPRSVTTSPSPATKAFSRSSSRRAAGYRTLDDGLDLAMVDFPLQSGRRSSRRSSSRWPYSLSLPP